MVVDEVGDLPEPPCRQLVEHLALVRHACQDTIEGRQAIGGDDQALLVTARPRSANLAVAPVGERELDLDEWFEQAGAHRDLHLRRCCDTVLEQP